MRQYVQIKVCSTLLSEIRLGYSKSIHRPNNNQISGETGVNRNRKKLANYRTQLEK